MIFWVLFYVFGYWMSWKMTLPLFPKRYDNHWEWERGIIICSSLALLSWFTVIGAGVYYLLTDNRNA
jgi:hypothetical protein